MAIFLFVLSLLVSSYLAISISAYKEVREKNIKINFNKKNVSFLLTVPMYVFMIHTWGFFKYYKEDKERAWQLLKLGTIKIPIGVVVFLEYVVHTAIVDYVYDNKNSSGAKIKTSSAKVKKQIMDPINLKKIFHNPREYQDSILAHAS